MKAYAIRGFTKGVETSLVEFVHYFIYAMLAYRLMNWVMIGQSNFEEFESLFQSSNQKGIDSLVTILAQLEAKWLRLILVSPILIGASQSIMSLRSAREVSSEQLQQITDDISEQLGKSSSFCRDTVREKLSILPGVSALGSRVQKLEQLTRWDGRLTVEDRRKSFESIRRAAKEFHQFAQLNALESLAKIIHGVGLKDLPRLYTVGYSKADLLEILYAKITALKELENLSQTSSQTWKGKFTSTPCRIYATYLLWWVGLSTSFWKQQLPFFMFKAVKLTIEIFFLQKIAESILEAIRCPDKPGFKFGDGYQDWASDYTAECFTTRISLFRTIDSNESVDALVAEIPQYHLTELNSLDLSSKYLTSEEASKIIQAVVQQKAHLKTLDLSFNQLMVINESMLSGLTQLNFLGLRYSQQNGQLNTLSDGVFNGLIQLNSLDLSGNGQNTLSNGVFNGLTQLNSLDLSNNQLSTLSNSVFSELTQLNYLYLYGNKLSTLNNSVFSKLTQLNDLDLWGNQLRTLSNGVFNGLTQLNNLDLSNNQLNTLSDDVFNELTQLNSLHFGGNRLIILNTGVFNGLSQLQSLYLNHNYFNTSALMDILTQLPSSLTELSIASNPMNYIPQNFSILLPIALQNLSVGGNYIPPTLTREFMQYFPKQLTSFSVTNSFISNITPRCFLDFSTLVALDLSSNQLKILNNGVFNGLTQLNYLDLVSNHLTTLSDDVFNGLTQLNTLYLDDNQLSTLSNDIFSKLTQLNILSLGSNKLNTLSNGSFSRLSQLLYLVLLSNQLNDLSIKNLTQNFPYQLSSLDLRFNKQIGIEGMLSLAEILPCTNLSLIYVDENSANTSLILAVQENTLRKVCESQRCHANLPASQSCSISQDSADLGKIIWGTESSIKAIEKDNFADMNPSATHYFIEFVGSYSLTHFSLPALPSPNFFSTSTTARVMAVGVIAFGFLIYKNATLVRNVVNAGCQFLQRCFYRTSDSKTSTNLYSLYSSNKTGKVCMDSYPTTVFNS